MHEVEPDVLTVILTMTRGSNVVKVTTPAGNNFDMPPGDTFCIDTTWYFSYTGPK